DRAPRLDELAVLGELADARRRAALEAFRDRLVRRHALRVVAVRHVDAAVGSDDDVVGLIEFAVGITGLAGHAETHQLFTLRAELVHLHALGALLVRR